MRGSTRHRRRALTLIEAVLSIVIVSLMLTAALHTVGASQRSQRYGADQATAVALAESLMSEVLGMPYQDPNGTGGIGPEADELGGTRATFDDVDDFAAWSASPPQFRSGLPMTAMDSFGRKVEVVWVNLVDLETPAASETGVKRVTVTVTCNGRPVIAITALRTDTLDVHAVALEGS